MKTQVRRTFVAALILVCADAPPFAQNFSRYDLAQRTAERRAVEAAI
jgi:hypothetical protein